MEREFTREFLMEELDLPWDSEHVVVNEITDQGRWETHYRLVFKHEDKFYETFYSKGSTEYQDTRPWEGEDKVTCTEVAPVEKTITVYEPIGE